MQWCLKSLTRYTICLSGPIHSLWYLTAVPVTKFPLWAAPLIARLRLLRRMDSHPKSSFDNSRCWAWMTVLPCHGQCWLVYVHRVHCLWVQCTSENQAFPFSPQITNSGWRGHSKLGVDPDRTTKRRTWTPIVLSSTPCKIMYRTSKEPVLEKDKANKILFVVRRQTGLYSRDPYPSCGFSLQLAIPCLLGQRYGDALARTEARLSRPTFIWGHHKTSMGVNAGKSFLFFQPWISKCFRTDSFKIGSSKMAIRMSPALHFSGTTSCNRPLTFNWKAGPSPGRTVLSKRDKMKPFRSPLDL